MSDDLAKKTVLVGSRNRAKTNFRVVPALLAGLGLILLGTAIWTLLDEATARAAAQPTDFSSIPASVHYPAPDLSLKDLGGVERSLSEYRGQVVLVNLWATWCPPCAAEMPNLQRFFHNHESEGFTVIAIDDGEPVSDVREFVAGHSLTFPVWLDPTYQATDHVFKSSNLPSSYVLDRTGNVRLMWIGAISTGNLEKYVTPLIREN